MNPVVAQFIVGFVILGVGCLLVFTGMGSPTWSRSVKDLSRGILWGGLTCIFLGALVMIAPILPFIF